MDNNRKPREFLERRFEAMLGRGRKAFQMWLKEL